MTLPANYDQWRLQGPPEVDEIGTEEGDTCNRYPEPDDDMPRGYRPRPCQGEMIEQAGEIVCEECGSLAQ